jgi:2,4-dienoyl-CoA reductase-like NADH-dependent reductase (Old Yellow Enzyme family)
MGVHYKSDIAGKLVQQGCLMDVSVIEPLFEPLAIKGLQLPNRFVLPAMQRGWCKDGIPDADLAEYYAARVAGGAGLIISEALAIDHPSATGQRVAAQIAPHTLDAWRRIVGRVKDANGNMFLQLFHEGALRPEGLPGTLSPSGLAWEERRNGEAASRAELDAIRDAYVRAASNAKSIGADGVEIHAAHGFLLDQFFWHETNVRDDGLGGPKLGDRIGYPVEVIRAVREEVGPDFVIGWRFSQWKEVDFGAKLFSTPGELQFAINACEDAGVDLFHASTRRFYQPEWPDSDLGLAGWTTRVGRSPVITVGSVGIRDLLFGEPGEPDGLDLLASLGELARRFTRGDFALVAVGRGMIADPDWVNKLRNGDVANILPLTTQLVGDGDDSWDMRLVMEGLERSAS